MSHVDFHNATARKRTVLGIFTTELLRYPWLTASMLFGTLLMQAADLTSPLYLRQFFNTLVLTTAHPTASVVEALVITLVIIGGLWLLDWLAPQIQVFSTMYIESKEMPSLYCSAL